MAKLNFAAVTKAAAEVEERKKPKVVLPDGSYDTIIQNAEIVSFKTGSRGVKITLEVCDGEFKGNKLYKQFVLFDEDLNQTEAGVSILTGTLMAAGLTLKEIQNFEVSHKPSEVGDLGSLKGRKVSAATKARTYEGRKINNVAFINAITLKEDPIKK